MNQYTDFLREKIRLASFKGFEVADSEINPGLRPHTRDIVKWAVQGGNRAIFASFGLHKTATQLEIMRQIGIHRPGLRLLCMPLGVRQEFKREVEQRFQGAYGVDLRFIRTDAEIDDPRTVYMTNYESIREGKLNPAQFRAASLDEASVLRSYGSKTFQEFLPLFAGVEFKFVNTATPSPNRYKELIHYAAFLGVMDSGQALTRFFQRDSQKAGNLMLYPHKEQEFWLWVASWAVFIQRPSDLGHSDEGYNLPALDVRYHEVPSDYEAAGNEKNGQGLLIPDVAMGLSAAAAEKRGSLPLRIASLMEIVDGYIRAAQGVPEGLSGKESGSLVGSAAGARQEGLPSQQIGIPGKVGCMASGQPGAIPGAHPEACGDEPRADHEAQRGLVPGEQGSGCVDLKVEQAEGIRSDAAGVPLDARRPAGELPHLHGSDEPASRRSRSHDRQGARPAVPALQCGIGPVQGQPGDAGESGLVSDQIVIWCDLNDEQDAIEAALKARGLSYSSVYGSLTIDEAERRLADWKAKRTYALIGKPVMLGQGLNLQQCNKAIFIGVTYKFNDLIQAVHRIKRFGQTRVCETHIVHTEAEREVLRTLQTKWAQHEEMGKKMTEIIRQFGLNQLAMHEVLARSIGIERIEVKGDLFTVANNDCVEEAKLQPTDSVDQIITSIPFANHYEYTPSYNDFGHTTDNEHFWKQMDFLTPELLRILKPGRMYCCHVKDRINFGNVTGAGLPTSSPFHCEATMHAIKHGFDYMGMITVVTDVVRENNQTYRLGYTEMCKDGTKMGVGSPEYILLFHKPQTDRGRGYADKPVVKSKSEYSLARWQVDAHAFWRSSGNRQLTAEEMASYGPGKLAKIFTDYTLQNVYDYEFHVKIGEELLERQALPSTFMSLSPGSLHSEVWHDVVRMLTLNGEQSSRNVEKHVCPLQFDIVDRLIERYSMKGEEIYDPFHGLGTVGVRAIKLGRKARGSELSPAYFLDQVHYLRAAEREVSMPDLFAVEALEAA